MPRHQQSLDMKQRSDRHLLVQKGMDDLLLFPFLISYEHHFAGIVRHQYRAGIGLIKALPLYLTEVDQGKGQPVRQKWPEFLHHVKSEPRPSGTIPVQKSYRRIKPHRFQGRPDIMHKECINEGKQGINVVQRRPAVSLLEGKGVFLCHD